MATCRLCKVKVSFCSRHTARSVLGRHPFTVVLRHLQYLPASLRSHRTAAAFVLALVANACRRPFSFATLIRG